MQNDSAASKTTEGERGREPDLRLQVTSAQPLRVGASYAVWVGVGAALTVGYAMSTGDEAVSAVRLLLVAGIVACVVGLKAVH